jgi:hypothetical protein
MLEKILRTKSTTIIAQQRWEENQVPPGVPICLTREKRTTLREIGAVTRFIPGNAHVEGLSI